MKIHNISSQNSVLNTFIAEIRDVEIQKDRMRFRRNIERIGEILSYEMSKSLNYNTKKIQSPLAEATMELPENDIVLCSILRAGVPLHTCPDLTGKSLVLADPMVATGQSLLATFEALKPFGTPKDIHLVAVIGAKEGINYIDKHFPENTNLWIAAIDDTLNSKGYIVPGLGDAGDLAFGEKLQQ